MTLRLGDYATERNFAWSQRRPVAESGSVWHLLRLPSLLPFLPDGICAVGPNPVILEAEDCQACSEHRPEIALKFTSVIIESVKGSKIAQMGPAPIGIRSGHHTGESEGKSRKSVDNQGDVYEGYGRREPEEFSNGIRNGRKEPEIQHCSDADESEQDYPPDTPADERTEITYPVLNLL